ncbi:formate dehydrogenase accessory sulfurtransferase FdhD [Aureimonas leprariae]|uniref:formate dehydrogenase accessory sulfurtransferase FdhD n=1 Tax=Plantimonas leprariae TaxID=2615207 RepID=UPI001FE44B80|nr:formate dehydrogenase accessory sulfurtransferase FdhD [Aureimonas leprariae]
MSESLASRRRRALLFRDGRFVPGERAVPEEVAVAISVDGSTHAVMMASPRDVEDLGLGLTLSERIVSHPREIERIEVVETEAGLDCQIRLDPERGRTYVARRRQMTGPVGCGLCGVESLELAAPVLPVVRAEPRFDPAMLAEAMEAMAREQRLGRETRAVHAAGFFAPDRGLMVVREDVGRHNALDKVVGHLARNDVDSASGFVAITSRVSVELIQKTAVMGSALIVAVSAPTALAIDEAERAGVTLVAVARGAEFEVFTHPRRLRGAVPAEEHASHAA